MFLHTPFCWRICCNSPSFLSSFLAFSGLGKKNLQFPSCIYVGFSHLETSQSLLIFLDLGTTLPIIHHTFFLVLRSTCQQRPVVPKPREICNYTPPHFFFLEKINSSSWELLWEPENNLHTWLEQQQQIQKKKGCGMKKQDKRNPVVLGGGNSVTTLCKWQFSEMGGISSAQSH